MEIYKATSGLYSLSRHLNLITRAAGRRLPARGSCFFNEFLISEDSEEPFLENRYVRGGDKNISGALLKSQPMTDKDGFLGELIGVFFI